MRDLRDNHRIHTKISKKLPLHLLFSKKKSTFAPHFVDMFLKSRLACYAWMAE